MKIKNYFVLTLITLFILNSCKKDDGAPVAPIAVDATPRGEQQPIDDTKFQEFFNSHYININELSGNINATINDINIISESDYNGLSTSEQTNYSLIDDVKESREREYLETTYQYYFVPINIGGGEKKPHFCDDAMLNYEGRYLKSDGMQSDVFDSTSSAIFFDLARFVKGWQFVAPEFNVAETFTTGQDGTVSFSNQGLGVMFIPSGLSYYVSPPSGSGIPLYSSLIFKFEIIASKLKDHDNDGIPSYLEDLNGDWILDENTDGDQLLDYQDNNDDNDSLNTIDEIENKSYEGDGTTDFTTRDAAETYYENFLASTEVFYSIVLDEDDNTYTLNTVIITDTNNDDTADYLDADTTIED